MPLQKRTEAEPLLRDHRLAPIVPLPIHPREPLPRAPRRGDARRPVRASRALVFARAALWGGVSLLGPAVVLAAWFLVTGEPSATSRILVPPAEVAAAARELIESGELLAHLQKSLVRLALGFSFGTGLGLLFGVLMGVSSRFEALWGPTFHAIRQVPSIAFIPMMILVFGVEETFKVVVVIKAAFFPVALGTADGLRGVPVGYREVARVLGFRPLQTLRHVLLPAIVPPVVTALRIAIARSWMVLVAAELLAAESGLGQMMEMGRQMFRIDVVLVGVCVTGLLGFLLDRSIRIVERALAPWRTT